MEKTFWAVAFTKGVLQPDIKHGKLNTKVIFNKFRSDELLISTRKPRYVKSIDQWKAVGDQCRMSIKTLNLIGGLYKTIEDFSEPRKVKFSANLVEIK